MDLTVTMTWLDILDTAIKIGLGAIIGGFFTVWANKQIHDNQIKKEILIDNRKTLKEIGSRFESIHIRVITLIQEMYSFIDQHFLETKSKIEELTIDQVKLDTKLSELSETDVSKLNLSELVELLNIPDTSKEIYKLKRDAVNNMVRDLYSLQGELMLHGYSMMSASIYDYTKNMSDLSSDRDALQGNVFERFSNMIPDTNVLQKFNLLRNLFYSAANLYLINPEIRNMEIYLVLRKDVEKYMGNDK
jgi:hypothetical protein